ncbi:hypothetical protein [Streptomyces mesophilus]|uniref:hypothetical protein n=1 Tax=Streptomyces mesophilus TaxID=1775132 RepID=UPI00331BE4A2
MTTDLSALTSAADKWDDMAGEFKKLETAYERDVAKISLGQTWQGFAATAANDRFKVTLREYQGAQKEAKAIAALLRDGHSQFTELRSKLKSVGADAIKAGMTVSEQGHVSFDTARLDTATRNAYHHDPDYQASVRQAVGEWNEAIVAAVKAIADADEGMKLALEAVVIDRDFQDGTLGGFNRDPQESPYPSLEEAGKAADIPKERVKVAEWWRSLEPATRGILLKEKADELKEAGIMDPHYQWRPADPGAGEFNSEKPTPKDLWILSVAQGLAAGGDVTGEIGASRNMEHYLRATGEPLELDVDRMLHDESSYRDDMVHTHITSNQAEWRQQALDEYNRAGGETPVAIPVESSAVGNYVLKEGEWFHAVGGHQQNVSGVVTVTPNGDGEPKVSLDYQVNVWDRYNWDKDKSTEFPLGIKIEDEDMARLHKVGFAQEFDMRGSSSALSYDLDAATPPSGDPGDQGRDGTRTDVSRGEEKNR